jgi:hypothetical protein
MSYGPYKNVLERENRTDIQDCYAAISQMLAGLAKCERTNNQEWLVKWKQEIEAICENELPSGSGIDTGTKLNFAKSTPDKLVFHVAYHHMNDGGYYDGWTNHTVTVRPTFGSVKLSISGPNRNDVKDYLYDLYQ